jgi:hypothetical protein
MQARGRNEHGAALVTVLLFMTLTFILISSMLTVTGNEVVISGIQRDSTRALEHAQAGVQEAVMRIQEGRQYVNGFTSSLAPNTTVTVFRVFTGVNSAYQEIRVTSTVGRATRRINFLVLQQIISFPPNITFAASVIEQGSADIICGDAYARTFIQYKNYPTQAPGCTEPPAISYAGWRMSKAAPGAVAPCYTHVACVAANPLNTNVARWYPGQRRGENETTLIGADIKAQTKKCPAGGGGTLPTDTIFGILASAPCDTDAACITAGFRTTYDVYGFETDDPDLIGPIPPQNVNSRLPCGFPYKLVAQPFQAEDGSIRNRLFKTIVFEQWFANYWRFDEVQMKVVKKDGGACAGDPYCLADGNAPNLLGNPGYGTVPPFPDVTSVENNFNCRMNGGGTINALPVVCVEPPGTPTSDLGCYAPVMDCGGSPEVSRQVLMLLDGGDYQINGTIMGHGTMVVDGNLIVNGNFEYWGTIIVKGQVTLGAGSAVIHGGLVADSTLNISGTIQVEGGGTVSSAPTGRSLIIGRGWWER